MRPIRRQLPDDPVAALAALAGILAAPDHVLRTLFVKRKPHRVARRLKASRARRRKSR
jgi:hypothetical protein